MSNSLVLDQLNQQARLEQRALVPYVEPPKPKKREWWQYLLCGLLDIASIAIELVADAFLGPVGGMIVGVAADITTNILDDLIMGDDPWEVQNIIFNIALPICTIPGKAVKASKIAKSSVRAIGEVADDVKIQKLASRLNKLDIDDNFATTGKRAYQQILDDLDLDKDIIRDFDVDDIKYFAKRVNDDKWKEVRKLERAVRRANKVVSFLADPNYAQKTIIKFIYKVTGFDKAVNKIAKKYRKFKKKIFSKFFKRKRPRHQLIPLQHVAEPWISGIRLQPASNKSINYYHVIIIFDARYTNYKKPVMLFNKSWRSIKRFIEAPSAGQYYINNISYGWDIGKMLRLNKDILNVFKIHNFASQYGQIAYSTFRLVLKTAELLDQIQNGGFREKFEKAWKPENVIMNIVKEGAGDLPGAKLSGKIVRSIQSHKQGYFNKYVKSSAKKFVSKKYHQFNNGQKLVLRRRENNYKNGNYRYKFN